MSIYKVTGTASESELGAIVSANIYSGYAYCIYSNRVELVDYKGILDVQHLLELRIFNENSEFKAVRSYLGEKFIFRVIDDNAIDEKEYRALDEKQYLDINATRSSGNNYETTGGGKYTLPIENAEKMKIRNYITYDEDGVAHFEDFRVVEILRKE